jgi:hypothetical protein
MKLMGIISVGFDVTDQMYLNETYSKVHVGKHLSDKFPIQKGLKQGDALSPLLFNFALDLCFWTADEKTKCSGLNDSKHYPSSISS